MVEERNYVHRRNPQTPGRRAGPLVSPSSFPLSLPPTVSTVNRTSTRAPWPGSKAPQVTLTKKLSLSSQCHTGTVPRWNPHENKTTFLFCTSGCRKSLAAGLGSLGVSVIKDVLWALGVPMACGPASQMIDIRVASGRQRAPPGSPAPHPARLSCQGCHAWAWLLWCRVKG